MDPKQRFSLWYFIAVVLALIAIQSMFSAPHKANLAYSEFKTLARQGKLSDLVLDGQTISGTLEVQGLDSVLPKERVETLKGTGKGPHLFVTARVDDPELVRFVN